MFHCLRRQIYQRQHSLHVPLKSHICLISTVMYTYAPINSQVMPQWRQHKVPLPPVIVYSVNNHKYPRVSSHQHLTDIERCQRTITALDTNKRAYYHPGPSSTQQIRLRHSCIVTTSKDPQMWGRAALRYVQPPSPSEHSLLLQAQDSAITCARRGS